jgi:hypothetical protein
VRVSQEVNRYEMWLHIDLHREIEVAMPLDTSDDANWEPIFAQPPPLGQQYERHMRLQATHLALPY